MIAKETLYFKDCRYNKRVSKRGNYHIIQNGSNNFGDGGACRETFHYSFNGQNRMGWSKSGISASKIDSFFNKISDVLGIKNELVIYNTNLKDVVVIQLSSFWNQNSTRQQLFTLFLRASTYIGTLSMCLYSYPLTRKIRPTIKHFLNGNINPTFSKWAGENGYPYNGIVSKFYNATPEFINKSLVK